MYLMYVDLCKYVYVCIVPRYYTTDIDGVGFFFGWGGVKEEEEEEEVEEGSRV